MIPFNISMNIVFRVFIYSETDSIDLFCLFGF